MASQNCKYSDDETKELQQSIQLSKHVGWANIQAYTWESPMPAELEWEAPGYPKPIASRTDYSSEKRSSEYRSQSHSQSFFLLLSALPILLFLEVRGLPSSNAT